MLAARRSHKGAATFVPLIIIFICITKKEMEKGFCITVDAISVDDIKIVTFLV